MCQFKSAHCSLEFPVGSHCRFNIEWYGEGPAKEIKNCYYFRLLMLILRHACNNYTLGVWSLYHVIHRKWYQSWLFTRFAPKQHASLPVSPQLPQLYVDFQDFNRNFTIMLLYMLCIYRMHAMLLYTIALWFTLWCHKIILWHFCYMHCVVLHFSATIILIYYSLLLYLLVKLAFFSG